MKREIKFRGIRVDNNQWVEGYFFKHWDKCYIAWGTINDNPVLIEVVPETVGQFTGLKDKNGKEIFEGDIVQHDAWDYPFSIIFNTERARFVCKMKTSLTHHIDNLCLTVIGNIHDNPELIK